MVSAVLCFAAAQIGEAERGRQFDEAVRALNVPARLEVRILKAKMASNTRIDLVICVKNAGGRVASLDPGMLLGSMLRLSLKDARGRLVRYRGDDREGYAPLDPEHPVRLASGMYYGIDRTVELDRPVGLVRVQATLTYGNPMRVPGVWTGTLHSSWAAIRRSKGKSSPR